jgi:hypothetical protein
MSKVICPMPQCVHRGEDGVCQSEVVEMMFGIVIQMAGRGAEAYTRCSQHRTLKDEEDNISSHA